MEGSASTRGTGDGDGPDRLAMTVRTVRVRMGETLRSIAEQHRQSVRTLEIANALPRQGTLRAGAPLIIPAGHRTMSRAALVDLHRRDLLDKLAMIRFVAAGEAQGERGSLSREAAVVALEDGLRCSARLFPECVDEDTRARMMSDARGLLQPGPLSDVAVDRLYAELSHLPPAGDAVALGRWIDDQMEGKAARLLDDWSYPPAFERLKRDAASNPEFLGLYALAAGADDFYVVVIESSPQRLGVTARVAYDAAGAVLATGERRYVRHLGAWEPSYSWRPPRSLPS